MFKNLFSRKTKNNNIRDVKNEIRYLIIVSGTVQCVGFRFFTFSTAKTLDLTGWVLNCDNGTVKIEVQGNENIMEKFLSKLKKGNGLAVIDDIFIKKIEPLTDEFNFRILN